MPLYEYECGQCGRFEIIQKFSDAPLGACPSCSRPVQKLLSAPAFQFKGTGWYVTDYARKPNGGESAAKSGEPAKGDEPAKSGEDRSAAKDKSTPTKTTPKDGAASSSSPSD